jgi:hypothetical protein
MVEPKFLHAIDKKSGRIFIIKTRNPAYICEIYEKKEETNGFEFAVKVHQGKYYLCRFIRFLEPVSSDLSLDTYSLAIRALTWYLQAIVKKEDNKNER